MFDKACLKDVLVYYKRDFVPEWWKNEKYKWEAVKCFQNNWDINAEDFYEMLHRSLDKTYNLLESWSYHARKTIELFAKSAPKEVKAMFVSLYDDRRDIWERIDEFKKRSTSLYEIYKRPNEKQHYQTENSISIYLWLRYPNKYYIYKSGVVKVVSNELKSKYSFKKGAYENNIRNFLCLYDEINAEMKKNSELIDLLKSQLADSCYSDPELKTLTVDIGFYIFICKKYPDDFGKNALTDSEKDEDRDMDTKINPVRYWLYAPGKNAVMWEDFYNRDIMGLGWRELGDLKTYTSKDEICDKLRLFRGGDSSYKNSANAVWQFANDIKIGDVIFVKRGRTEIVGRGLVAGDYEYDENDKSGYSSIRKVKWTHKGSWQIGETFALKTLTDITDDTDLVETICSLFEVDNSDDDFYPIDYPIYTKADFLAEVYMTENKYEAIVNLLRNKKNIIFQGAPGVGKTFAAVRLAWTMMGGKNEDRIAFVQFHQNYSYEDFVMGYKPVKDGFELKEGLFYQFCKKSERQPDKEFFFIIDEINRGNMSKIFGELLMLIEKDYRGKEIALSYNGESFSVPENLYIIGMMNTADRSLAMIDYALRRRFSFIDMEPAFDSDGFTKYQKQLSNEKLDSLIKRVKELNTEIAGDKSLGKSFCIGHSYFCGQDNCTDEWLRSIVEYDIIPTLSEYWFDDDGKKEKWENILRGVFND